MYIHNLDPIFLDLGFFEIRWYSLAYIIGILSGWWLGKKILTFRTNSSETTSYEIEFDNLISYLIIGIIIGGRIGYIIFYNLSFYIQNPLDIIKIWEGGMSFHGGLIGVILTTYIFSYKKKLKSLVYLDIISCVTPIGLFFGRVANFINAELYGKPTDVIWAVIFPVVDEIPRHPSQLYEAFLEGIVLFLILIFKIFRSKTNTGVCSCLFLIFYGLFRIFSELFREPDIQIGYIYNFLSMGTFLSLIMIVLGAALLIKINKNAIKY